MSLPKQLRKGPEKPVTQTPNTQTKPTPVTTRRHTDALHYLAYLWCVRIRSSARAPLRYQWGHQTVGSIQSSAAPPRVWWWWSCVGFVGGSLGGSWEFSKKIYETEPKSVANCKGCFKDIDHGNMVCEATDYFVHRIIFWWRWCVFCWVFHLEWDFLYGPLTSLTLFKPWDFANVWAFLHYTSARLVSCHGFRHHFGINNSFEVVQRLWESLGLLDILDPILT